MLEVLGELRVTGDSGPVVLRSRYQRMLLAALVLDRGHVMSVDRLADAVWRDDLPTHPQAALHSQISRLRRILPSDARIETEGGGYRLVVPDDGVDVARFEAAWAKAGRASPRERLDLVTTALDSWQGEPYAELDDERAQAEAARLHEIRLSMLELRPETLLEVGDIDAAVAEAERLHQQYPLRERIIAASMRALTASGRVPDALRVFAEHRRRLADELGLDPSTELQALESKILRNELVVGRAPLVTRRIPQPPSSFIGGERAIDVVADLVTEQRIVTLTGPGGVGKTRLMLEVAHRVGARFADGVALIELAEADANQPLADLVASALDVAPQSETPILDRICEILDDRNVLLLLDNCEHVADAAADLVSRIVGSTRRVHVLATSRERLGCDGEHRWVVEPLRVGASDDRSHGPAIALFRDRAVAVKPDFVLDDTNLEVVAEICQALDGLPLALELAAARLASMSVEEIATGLDERFSLLDRGQRSSHPRQGSLWRVVDWSFRQLDEAHAGALLDLSVFSGSFTIADAVELEGRGQAGRSTVSSLVSDLVERSLIVQHPISGASTRYSMLETVRAFAREQLADRGAMDAALDRHAAWVTTSAEAAARQLVDERETDAARWLAESLAELRAAHRHALTKREPELAFRLAAALHRWAWPRLQAETLGWAEATAERFAGTHHPSAAACFASASTGAWQRGDLAAARRFAESSREAAGPAGDARADEAMGDVELLEGRLDEARSHYATAAAAAAALDDPVGQIVNEGNLVLASGYVGDADAVVEHATTARDLLARYPAPTMLAWIDFCEGEATAAGDPDRGLMLLRRAVEEADAAGARFISGVAGLTWMTTRARNGNPLEDLDELVALLRLWQQDRLWTQEWTALRTVVDLLATWGEEHVAARLLGAMESSRYTAAVFGDDAARLATTRAKLADALGAALETEIEVGRALSDDDAVDLAVSRLAALAAAS